MWIYVLGPIFGGIIAGLFHWNNTSVVKKMYKTKFQYNDETGEYE